MGLRYNYESNLSASEYSPGLWKESLLLKDFELYEIDVDRTLLRDKIEKRTKIMLKSGLIGMKLLGLRKPTPRAPNSSKSDRNQRDSVLFRL